MKRYVAVRKSFVLRVRLEPFAQVLRFAEVQNLVVVPDSVDAGTMCTRISNRQELRPFEIEPLCRQYTGISRHRW